LILRNEIDRRHGKSGFFEEFFLFLKILVNTMTGCEAECDFVRELTMMQ
jgi:hypothetical protein